MDNYNPRQPTRFRFKDSREMEKFKFLTGNYDFEEQELLENVSQDKTYEPIIEVFKETIRTNKDIGVILYDGPTSQNTYIGYILREIGYLYTIINTSILIINLEYDNQRDTLSITNTIEDILVADNVKTLFGNQSIIGQGNIDLYRHDLIIYHKRTSYDDYEYKVHITYYSSNSLKVDSVQDLTTLTKAINGTKLFGPVVVNNTTGDEDYDTISQSYIGLGYDGSIWCMVNLNDNLVTSIPINNVSDTVTAI